MIFQHKPSANLGDSPFDLLFRLRPSFFLKPRHDATLHFRCARIFGGNGPEFRHWLVTVDLVIADTIQLNLAINFCLLGRAKLNRPEPTFPGHLC